MKKFAKILLLLSMISSMLGCHSTPALTEKCLVNPPKVKVTVVMNYAQMTQEDLAELLIYIESLEACVNNG